MAGLGTVAQIPGVAARGPLSPPAESGVLIARALAAGQGTLDEHQGKRLLSSYDLKTQPGRGLETPLGRRGDRGAGARHVTLQPGEVIISKGCGGGGYESPLLRDPARVLHESSRAG